MSSDVMIVCKEFKNSYDNNNPKIPAMFIDEASMGEPHHEFAKWFVDKYYNGYSMIEVMMFSKDKGQDEVDKLEHEIFDNPFTLIDHENISNAMDKMTCHQRMDKQKVKDYLESCVGKSISTENW